MNLTQIRAFHLVAQGRSFTAAARLAGISQPTLSEQVRAIESQHGVRLFDRRGRGVQLTDLGQSLFAITSRLFALEDEAEALLQGTQALTRGHLRVSADSAYHVIPIMAELRRQHGGITFSLKIDNSAEVLKHLLDFEADIAVTAKQTSDPRLHAVKFRSDRLIAFVPKAHPMARAGHIPIQALGGQDMVLRERGSITREVMEQALAEARITPNALTEVETREGVREAVAAGFGIGIVFASEFGTDDRFHPLEIRQADLGVAEYIVCHQERRRIALIRTTLEIAAALSRTQR